jgi:AcrR family transcriptional regulator
MGALRTPRERWVEEGLRALSAGGVDAVRVEALAKSLGVTKGGFCGHFADRDVLLEAMLDWARRDPAMAERLRRVANRQNAAAARRDQHLNERGCGGHSLLRRRL